MEHCTAEKQCALVDLSSDCSENCGASVIFSGNFPAFTCFLNHILSCKPWGMINRTIFSLEGALSLSATIMYSNPPYLPTALCSAVLLCLSVWNMCYVLLFCNSTAAINELVWFGNLCLQNLCWIQNCLWTLDFVKKLLRYWGLRRRLEFVNHQSLSIAVVLIGLDVADNTELDIPDGSRLHAADGPGVNLMSK